jgi:hypothetical protein
MFVVDAFVAKRLVAVRPVVEALVRVVLPLDEILNHCAFDDEATVKRFSVFPDVPVTESLDPGVVDPIPRRPFEPKLNIEIPVEEAIVNSPSVGAVEVPEIVKREVEVVVPTPTFPLARIAKNDVPVDEATLNGLMLDVDVACTLNA